MSEMVQRSPTAIISGTVAVGLSVIFLVVFMIISGTIVSAIINPNQEVSEFDPTVGQEYVVDSTIDTVPAQSRVAPTTGYTVNLNGSDTAGITWNSSGTPTIGPWTLCAWTALDNDSNLDATYDIAAIGSGAAQIEYDAGNWMAYFDNGTHSAVIRASAPQPRTPATICARYDGTSLNLVRNGSQVASQQLTTATETRNISVTLNGRVDEVRVSNSTVSNAKLSTYASEPSVPFDGTNRAARLMLDEGTGNTSAVYHASGDAELSGHTWVTGVPAYSLEEGVDYNQTENPWTITPVASGDLDGQPVAYVVYTGGGSPFGGQLLQIVSIAQTAFILLSVALLSIPAVAVILVFRGSGLLKTSMR